MDSPLIDSAIWIDHLNGHPEATAFVFSARADGQVDMHAIVAAELTCGALNKRQLKGAERAIGQSRLLIPTDHDWRVCQTILARYWLADSVDIPDALLAATAMRLRRTVATINEKHFRCIRGLKFIRPY